jgi:hypothetical protein
MKMGQAFAVPFIVWGSMFLAILENPNNDCCEVMTWSKIYFQQSMD